MNGPEHYRIAEQTLQNIGDADSDVHVVHLLAEAQVHATLALAAATALPRNEGGPTLHMAWKQVTR